MRASPEELVDSYQQRAELCLNIFDSERRLGRKDYVDAICVLEQAFSAYLVCGKIEWRCKLHSPIINFRKAISTAKLAASCAGELKITEVAKSPFQFGSAALLDFLIHSRFTETFVDLVPSVQDWKSFRRVARRKGPDAGLIYLLQNKTLPKCWEEMLEGVSVRPKKSDLYVNSYRSYAGVIEAYLNGKKEEMLKAINASSRLFEERVNDDAGKYYPALEGGSGITSKIVDHRLSAAIRFCYKRQPPKIKDLKCFHRWDFT